MTDRFKGALVTFDGDIREDESEQKMTKLPRAIIIELDGVLADNTHRQRLLYPSDVCNNGKWATRWNPESPAEKGFIWVDKSTGKYFVPDMNAYHEAMGLDSTILGTVGMLLRLNHHIPGFYGLRFLFVTDRPGKYRELTESWIERFVLDERFDRGFHKLFMRPDFLPPKGIYVDDPNNWIEDTRPSYEVKREIYMNHVKDKYDVLFVLEAEDDCAQMYQDLGLCVLKVLRMK